MYPSSSLPQFEVRSPQLLSALCPTFPSACCTFLDALSEIRERQILDMLPMDTAFGVELYALHLHVTLVILLFILFDSGSSI